MLAGMALPENDWFLSAWLDALGTSQADLCRRTGWDKRKASFLVNGRQEYRRTEVNEAALALNVETWELLMHPDDAMALRRMREGALRIAAEPRSPWHGKPAEIGAEMDLAENG